MNSRNRSQAVRIAPVLESSDSSPSISTLLDELIRRGARGDRAAIGRIASIFRFAMVNHAADHLGRFDAAAEDVFQEVLLAMLEGKLRPPSKRQSATHWLLRAVETFARGERRKGACRWALDDDGEGDCNHSNQRDDDDSDRND